ncbi:MAG: hypothetical protein ACJ79O_01330 [Myxococcales bacterium]
MKVSTVIGFLILGASLGAMSAPAHAESRLAGRWQGVLLRDGLQLPISVDLTGADQDLSGGLRVDDAVAPIRSARASLASVHFEVPGEGIFDGTVAGNSMAGSVSGTANPGSFSLARESDSPFSDPITSSGP